tara:strand:- start:377 stop:499 length:123 start_codon:yes stop_codon:yes gene_type:complete
MGEILGILENSFRLFFINIIAIINIAINTIKDIIFLIRIN